MAFCHPNAQAPPTVGCRQTAFHLVGGEIRGRVLAAQVEVLGAGLRIATSMATAAIWAAALAKLGMTPPCATTCMSQMARATAARLLWVQVLRQHSTAAPVA